MIIKRGPKPKKLWAKIKKRVIEGLSKDEHYTVYRRLRHHVNKKKFDFHGGYDGDRKISTFIVSKKRDIQTG